jgi:hydrogenase expression/formation protein HypE
MHDPTEGGLATALAELADASGVGVMLDKEKCPILPECKMICDVFGLDPLGTLASGSLLVAVAQADADSVIQFLTREGIPCAQIGTVVRREQGLKMQTKDGVQDLPRFQREEITKVL